MGKRVTQRALAAFRAERATKLAIWRNMRGISMADWCLALGCSEPTARGWERGKWINAMYLKRMRDKFMVPASILYLDGKALHEVEV
jgi:hypothetical protein